MSDSDGPLGEKATQSHHEFATDKGTAVHEEFSSKMTAHGHKKTKEELIHEIDARATAPGVTRESFNHIDEKKLLRKMDLRLLPMLTLLYLLSFIDRGNIGNAKIEGLAEDLKLTGYANFHYLSDCLLILILANLEDSGQYNWCLTAFFLTYCAFEPPSNIILKRIRPSIWLPGIMVGLTPVLIFNH
jgi:hypothetical protein